MSRRVGKVGLKQVCNGEDSPQCPYAITGTPVPTSDTECAHAEGAAGEVSILYSLDDDGGDRKEKARLSIGTERSLKAMRNVTIYRYSHRSRGDGGSSSAYAQCIELADLVARK